MRVSMMWKQSIDIIVQAFISIQTNHHGSYRHVSPLNHRLWLLGRNTILSLNLTYRSRGKNKIDKSTLLSMTPTFQVSYRPKLKPLSTKSDLSHIDLRSKIIPLCDLT